MLLSALSLLTCAQPVPAKPATASGHAALKSDVWPAFRGPGGNGQAVDANPPVEWDVPINKNIRWKTSIPRMGMNSPVVWKNRLFLAGADETAREIYCFATDSGQMLWRHLVRDIPGAPSQDELPDVMETSGLAPSTATTDGRYLAAIFATGELICTDLDGRRVWAKHLGVPRNHYGHASSLIDHDSLLFVQFDQARDSKLLAFDFPSGKLVWEAKRGPISWASPILITNNARLELIAANCKTVDSYEPKTGQQLWQVEILAGEVAASPSFAGGTIYIASEGAVAAALEISNHDVKPKVLWTWDEALPDASSPVATERYVIIPSSFGVVTCLHAKTGRKLWEHEFKQGFYSAPILANGLVYLCDMGGNMQVFKLGDRFELITTSKLGEKVYATPAFVGPNIYIRGFTHLFCVGNNAK